MCRATSPLPWIWLVSIVAVSVSAAGAAFAVDTISENAFNRCRAISDETARLHCFENLTSQTSQTEPFHPQGAPSSLPVAGKWRLVRTPNPKDGQDVISIMTTAELSGSDSDFAGLMLRCADSEYEILVFLIRPLPPRARPAVSINGNIFQGSVVPPGASILLPKAAAVLAKEQWQSLPSLSVNVEDNGTTTHGLVSLEGFRTALQTLVDACLTR